MNEKSPEAFRTISEVAEWLGVPTHVLRFWESRFAQVKPVKRAGGRRYYRPADMELLGGIRKLLHEDGMTIRGVQKLLRERGVRYVAGMSPALDSEPEMRDVTPSNVVEFADRQGSEAEEETYEAGAEEEEFPAPPVNLAPPAPARTYEESEAEPALAAPEAPGPQEPATAELEKAQPPEPEFSLEPPEAGPGPAAEAEPETPLVLGGGAPEPALPEEAAPAPDLADPLSGPEALDFLSHDAQPETFEPDGPAGEMPAPEIAPEVESAEEESGPEPLSALPTAADALPEPEELPEPAPEAMPVSAPIEPSEAQASPLPGPIPEVMPEPFAAAEAAPSLPVPEAEEELVPSAEAAELPESSAEAAPEEPEKPGLSMPEIGPDPEDNSPLIAPGPRVAVQLRAARAARAELSAAALEAFRDRLEEIACHIPSEPAGRHRF